MSSAVPSSTTTTMDSIRSILIRTCMNQIHKELGQLEHWLIHLPEDKGSVSSSTPSAPSLPLPHLLPLLP